jgi:hypothetical protein
MGQTIGPIYMMDDVIKPPGPTSWGSEHFVCKSLREYLAATQDGIAAEAPDDDQQLHAGMLIGKSPTRRQYRLCMRWDRVPQAGQAQQRAPDRARTITRLVLMATSSTTKPSGTRLEGRSLCIVLIPLWNTAPSHQLPARK